MEIYGKKVVDSKKPLHINVTREDCKKAVPKSERECAAALAIIREYSAEGVIGAAVHRGVTYVEYDRHWKRYLTPVSLRTELTVLDRGAGFEPGPHTLPAPYGKAQSLANLKKPREPKPKARIAKGTRHEISNIRPRGANR